MQARSRGVSRDASERLIEQPHTGECRLLCSVDEDTPHVYSAGAENDTLAQAKYLKSPMTSQRALFILDKLDRKMQQEQLYLDNSLDLKKLSERSGLRSHDVSQALNQKAGQKFFDYLNGYRISAAMQMLRDDLNTSIFDVAMETGFNSKSTFYNAFKKIAGMTPLQYRRECLWQRKTQTREK